MSNTHPTNQVSPTFVSTSLLVGVVVGFIAASIVLANLGSHSWFGDRIIQNICVTLGVLFGIIMGFRSTLFMRRITVGFIVFLIAYWIIPIVAYNSGNPALTQ